MLKLPLSVAAFLFFTAGHNTASALEVAVSIKPLHSLVSAVMAGAGQPDLIVKGNGSPHDYQFKPSDARMLQKADAVFWVGEGLETFLHDPVKTLASKARVVAMDELDTLNLIKHSDDEKHDDHDHHDKHDDHAHEGHDHGDMDPHVWLDPENARSMVKVIAQTLTDIDPKNGDLYRANADALDKRLHDLDHHLEEKLHDVSKVPFVVFHDAYGYFERRYHLNVAAKITVSPTVLPGAKRLKEVREDIMEHKARCVFAEPQFQPGLVRTVIEGTGAKDGVLDPLGATLAEGPQMYFSLLENLANDLVKCLAK